MKMNIAAAAISRSGPSGAWRTTTFSRRPVPQTAATSAPVTTSMFGVVAIRSTRYRDIDWASDVRGRGS